MNMTTFKDVTEISNTRFNECPLGKTLENKKIDKPIDEYDKSLAFFDKLESDVEVSKPERTKNTELVNAFVDSCESDYLSTYEERIKQTPTDKNTERGQYEGERGESKYISSDENINNILDRYGLDGINYHDGIPDFSKCSESTIEIDDMTENRAKNFKQCDEKCAEQWNNERKDEKTDWTPRDVAKWREENGYSWHERNDMKTCDLVPTEINDYFGHLGGVSECRKRDDINYGGDFDE